MEISLEAIISIVGLLLSGGGGAELHGILQCPRVFQEHHKVEIYV